MAFIRHLRSIIRLAGALLAILLVLTGTSVRAEGEEFSGCMDGQGRPVASVSDSSRPLLVEAVEIGGRPALRSNPSQLSRLPLNARLFFYAHECARIALGFPLAAPRSSERARRADCWALATLQRSGVLAADEGATQLAADLRLTDTDWQALPGPRREFDFLACSAPQGALRLPDAAPPSEATARVDRCVQGCGDRLWQCQNRCSQSACRSQCEAAYEQCDTRCAKP